MLIDIVFVLILMMALVKGFSRGLIVAVFSLLAYIIGMAAALKFSAVVAVYLQQHTGSESKWLPFLAFIIVFAGVILLVRLTAVMIKKAVSLVLMGWLDKLGGVLLYAIAYIMIYSVLLFFATRVHLISSDTAAASSVYEYVVPWGPRVINGIGVVIPLFSGMFSDLSRFFSK